MSIQEVIPCALKKIPCLRLMIVIKRMYQAGAILFQKKRWAAISNIPDSSHLLILH